MSAIRMDRFKHLVATIRRTRRLGRVGSAGLSRGRLARGPGGQPIGSPGAAAAWPSGLGRGLQSPVRRFDSARRLGSDVVDRHLKTRSGMVAVGDRVQVPSKRVGQAPETGSSPASVVLLRVTWSGGGVDDLPVHGVAVVVGKAGPTKKVGFDGEGRLEEGGLEEGSKKATKAPRGVEEGSEPAAQRVRRPASGEATARRATAGI